MDTIALAEDNWRGAGWDEAASGMAAVTSVMRAAQILQARVDDVLKPFELTFARYEVLMLLHFSSRGSMPVTKMGVRLQVHPTSITNAVDRLETAALVRRRPHPTDGRAVLVELTPDGRRVALEATDALNIGVFSAPGLPPRRVTTLLTVLGEFRRAAGDFA